MSIEPKKPSLLAPLADEYELSDADADRAVARIQATLAQGDLSSLRPRGDVGRIGSGKKVLLAGASCLAIAVAGALALYAASPSEAPAPEAVAPLAAPSLSSEPPSEPEEIAVIPAISVDALPSVEPLPAPRDGARSLPVRAGAAVPAPAPAVTDALAHETRLIAEARAALKDDEADRALSLLGEHARLYPNGWLASDRAAERVAVLCGLGRRAEAVREAKAFLDGRPESPLTRRVQASCAGEPSSGAGE